tara:strand:+ start:10658 stop:12448 length:1791 start_codon:yes stop_codon:yes gene_type:complete
MQQHKKKFYFEKDDYHLEGSLVELIKGLLKFLSPYKLSFFYALILIFISSLLAMTSARVMGLLVDEGLAPKNWGVSLKWGGIILALETMSLLALWRGRYTLVNASSKGLLDIRKNVFKDIQFISMGYFDKQPEGRTVTRMTHDIESLEDFFSGSLGRLLNALILFIVSIFAMLLTNLNLGLTLLSGLIPVFILTYFSRRKVRTLNHQISRYNSALNAKLSEYLRGVMTLRIFGWERWSLNHYGKAIEKHKQSFLNANNFYAWNRPLTNFLCTLPIILLFWFGGLKVLNGALEMGLFVAFIRYCERFTTPLANVTREVQQIQQSLTSGERILSFLNAQKEEDVLGKDGNLTPKPSGGISFQNVSMYYSSDQWILNDLNFTIHPGEKIGLVGKTGSGKTTTLNLLGRLYPFQKGTISIWGQDIKKFKRSHLRKNIGFVSQKALFFKGTIKENIFLEEKDFDLTKEKALKELGLYQWLEEKGLTLNSPILENGSNLSEGEKQFLSISRVLIQNPALLILDEATAHIDIKNEEKIQSALDQIMENKTCLIVAHRLHTLRNCDRLFVFKNGRLIEEGNHEDLIEKKGEFYNLSHETLKFKA